MRARVTTRLEKRKNHIRSQYTKKLNRVEVISRFINPCTSYRISNTCFIDERFLDTQFNEDNQILSVMDWNSITHAKQTKDYIHFTMEPRRRQFELPPQYLIQRLKSFGNEKMHSLAMSFSQLLEIESQQYQELSAMFPSNTRLLEQNVGKNYMIFGGQFTRDGPIVNSVIISRQLLEAFNIDEEALMVEAVKFGRLPLRLSTNATSKLYLDKYMQHLKLKIAYHRFALASNTQGIQYLQKMAAIDNNICFQAPQNMVYKMKSKIRGTTHAHVTMSSPIHVTIQMKNVEVDSTDDQSDGVYGPQTEHFDKMVEEQCDLLQKFINVPREARPKLRKKICKVRNIPKPLPTS